MINYRKFDDRMKSGLRLKKIQFALDMEYKHYSQMIHELHKEGMTSGKIKKWIEERTEDFLITTSAIDHTLRIIGVFKYTKLQRKSKQEVDLCEQKKMKDRTHIKKMCACCGLNCVSPGNRMLCSGCYTRNSATERHGTGYKM